MRSILVLTIVFLLGLLAAPTMCGTGGCPSQCSINVKNYGNLTVDAMVGGKTVGMYRNNSIAYLAMYEQDAQGILELTVCKNTVECRLLRFNNITDLCGKEIDIGASLQAEDFTKITVPLLLISTVVLLFIAKSLVRMKK